jgi:hypothetical protein
MNHINWKSSSAELVLFPFGKLMGVGPSLSVNQWKLTLQVLGIDFRKSTRVGPTIAAKIRPNFTLSARDRLPHLVLTADDLCSYKYLGENPPELEKIP